MTITSTRSICIWILAIGLLCGVSLVLVVQLFNGGWTSLLGVITTQGGTLTNTLLFGMSTATAATLGAWLVSHVQHSYRFFGRNVLHWLCLAPLLMPSFTVAMALVIAFGSNGLLVRAIGMTPGIYGLGGLVIAGTLARFPYAYLILLIAYRGIEPELLDTAHSFGASRRRVVTLVLWPKLRSSLVTVWLLVFADTVADLANPLVVGGNFHVVASRLYEAVNGEGDLGAASAYAVLLLVPSLLYGLVAHRVGATRSTETLSRTSAGLQKRPGLFARCGIVLVWVGGAFIAILLFSLLVAAISSPSGGPGLGPFVELFTVPGNRALASTLLVAVVAVPATVLLSLFTVLAVAADLDWLDRAARWCGRASAVPSVVLGLCGYLWLIAGRGVSGHATSWGTAWVFMLLVVVLLVRSVPTAALSMIGRARELLPNARDAAVTLGVSGWKLVRLIYLPRFRGPIRDAVVLTTARTLTATSSVILLSDIQFPMFSVRMLIDTEAGRVASAGASAVLVGAVIGLVVVVANWGWGRD